MVLGGDDECLPDHRHGVGGQEHASGPRIDLSGDVLEDLRIVRTAPGLALPDNPPEQHGERRGVGRARRQDRRVALAGAVVSTAEHVTRAGRPAPPTSAEVPALRMWAARMIGCLR